MIVADTARGDVNPSLYPKTDECTYSSDITEYGRSEYMCPFLCKRSATMARECTIKNGLPKAVAYTRSPASDGHYVWNNNKRRRTILLGPFTELDPLKLHGHLQRVTQDWDSRRARWGRSSGEEHEHQECCQTRGSKNC